MELFGLRFGFYRGGILKEGFAKVLGGIHRDSLRAW